jgi:predicted GIY-YIG superfamily endonuclease
MAAYGSTKMASSKASPRNTKSTSSFTTNFFYDIESAIAREKQLKGWSRAKKIALIEKRNPGWEDLPLPDEI